MKPYYIIYRLDIDRVFYERFDNRFEMEAARQRVKEAGYRVITTGYEEKLNEKRD